MSKKIIQSVLIGVFAILTLIFLWYGYSLFRFDGYFSPSYVTGLSNPYKYYQEHIGTLLLEYGQEYKIDDVDTSSWEIYKDESLGFEFKYPSNLKIDIQDRTFVEYYIYFHDENNFEKKCSINIKFRGRGVGKTWLPKKRKGTEDRVKINKLESLWHIKLKDNSIFGIGSSRFYQADTPNLNQGTGVLFIGKKKDEFVHIFDYGNTCELNVLKGMFLTFQFIEQ